MDLMGTGTLQREAILANSSLDGDNSMSWEEPVISAQCDGRDSVVEVLLSLGMELGMES